MGFRNKEGGEEAEFFIVLLSQTSVSKKGYIQRELKLAMELLEEIPEGEIYLIPVKIDDCLVPAQFAAFQWVALQGSESYEQIRKSIRFQLTSRTRQSGTTKSAT
jgi:TIR domain